MSDQQSGLPDKYGIKVVQAMPEYIVPTGNTGMDITVIPVPRRGRVKVRIGNEISLVDPNSLRAALELAEGFGND